MRAWTRSAGLAAFAAALACACAQAGAAPPPPINLAIDGVAGAWRAEQHSYLTWELPPVGSGQPLARVHIRLRYPNGAIATHTTELRTTYGISAQPRLPGAYRAEVWLEDAAGGLGPAATAQLLFDDTRPEPIDLPPLPEWLGRNAFPLRIRLGHPPGPPPLSGILGYAVSIDASPFGLPCQAADRCTLTETTLAGGLEEDELTVTLLPDGTSHLHAVAVSGAGMKSPAGGHAVLHVDTANPVVRLTGAPPGWINRTARIAAIATDAHAGMAPRRGGVEPYTAIRVDDRVPAVAFGASVSTEVVGEGAHPVAYYARDAAGNVADGALSDGIPNQAPRTSWVRIDRTPPTAAFATSQDPRDPDLLRVTIADPLSGPDPARGWIGVRRVGSGDRFARLPAERPGADELRARWRSDAYPRGTYEFRAGAYDAAGNLTLTGRRRDGAPMTLPNPLKASSTLRAGFHRRRLRRAAPYGRRIRISGRLNTGRSTPLGGMPVRIVERFAAGARPAVRVSTVSTKPDGRFSHRLAPGPSRVIAVSYEGGAKLARAAARPLELRVRSRVRLRSSTRVARVGGAPVIFRGRLLAERGAIPRGGRPVQLQFRLPGTPWTSFRTLETNRRGRFRFAYRFSDDDSRGARFQFRAFAPAQEDWPYEPGGSRPVLVRGR